jgi:hypothetical protein
MTTAYNSDATEAVIGSIVGNPRTRHPFSARKVTDLALNTRHTLLWRFCGEQFYHFPQI